MTAGGEVNTVKHVFFAWKGSISEEPSMKRIELKHRQSTDMPAPLKRQPSDGINAAKGFEPIPGGHKLRENMVRFALYSR